MLLTNCTETWEAELRINDNESIHANTYSEIVRMGFPVPTDVLRTMLKHNEAHRRLEVVGEELKRLKRNSLRLAWKKEFEGYEVTQEDVVEDMIMFYFIMFVLENYSLWIHLEQLSLLLNQGGIKLLVKLLKRFAKTASLKSILSTVKFY